jgi:hypothetical protein
MYPNSLVADLFVSLTSAHEEGELGQYNSPAD